MPSSPIKLIVGGILAVCGLIFFLSTYFTVAEYERTVVTTFGKFSHVANPGLHFRIPFVNSTTTYHVGIESMVISAGKGDKGQLIGVNTYSVDNQEVDIIATVQYRIPPEKVQFLFENVQDYRTRLFDMIVDRLKSEMGKVNATHVAEKRGEIKKAVQEVLQKDAKLLGINVTDFQLTNIEYQKGFRDAVAAAANAKAGIDTRENEQKQQEKVAETKKIAALGEANAAREKAKGEADAIDVKAKAEARAIQIKGEAQAAAMKAQATALSANPVLVEMKKAEQWNGALPTAIYAGAPIPFMQAK
jgi:regulator of protease activity HflC (stomatin/prohibitin superfamily)